MSLGQYLKTHKKTHLIFDLDETILELILPWEDWENPIEDELRKIDMYLLKEYRERKIGLNQFQNSIIEKHSEAKKLIIKNNEDFEKQLKDIRINKELADFIKSSKLFKLYIWSSNSESTIEKVLKKIEIFQKFQKIVSRNNVTFLKPNPEGFGLIWDKKTPKGKFLFIGDSANDKQVSESIGIDYYQVKF